MSTTPTAPPPAVDSQELQRLAGEVDQAAAAVDALQDDARQKAHALKQAVEAFHKGGLTHIIKTLKADPRGRELLYSLAEEPAVYALFAMHGLVRADVASRAAKAIELVRPYMQSHGGDVALVSVREGVATVRLEGSCNGCSMSSVTLKNTVEETLREHVPEITAVEVADEAAGPLVQIAMPGESPAASGWVEGPAVADLSHDRPSAFESGEHKIIVLQTADGVKAYRNACAHQGLPLDRGAFDAESGVLTCPWHGFRFDAESGECFSAPQCQLEPFPVRVEEGRVLVRPE